MGPLRWNVSEMKSVPDAVKVLLQQPETGFFVGQDAPLVIEQKEARTFNSSLDALDFCFENGFKDVEVLLMFSDSQYDFRLRPFGNPELHIRVRQFASHAERLACLHQEIKKRAARARQTFAEIESLALEAKERRKTYPFKPKRTRLPGDQQPGEGDLA